MTSLSNQSDPFDYKFKVQESYREHYHVSNARL